MEKLFQSAENKILAVLSIALGINTLFFIAREVKSLNFLILSQNTHIFYFIYLALGICLSGTLLFYATGFPWREWSAKKLLVLFPTVVLLIFALAKSKHFHYVFQIAVGLYIIFAGLFLIILRHRKNKADNTLEVLPKTTLYGAIKNWFTQQKKSTLVILALLVVINLSFGSYRIAQYAAVDEALWTFGGRISTYWNNIAVRNWDKTRVSDKPGVTVSIISGAGLLFETPKDYKLIRWESGGTQHPKNDIQKLNFALRFPILLFTALMLPFFYFFLEQLLGERKALVSTILIGTSPILLGMSRIINPDSLLWIFATLSLVSYFIFLKRHRFIYLYWAGIFLGLALLTKYVANILFIFFFGLIFLEYILMGKKTHQSIDFVGYIKTSFLNYFAITFIALSVFYILYPAVWIKPSRILEATLLSQAFNTTWPLFIGIIAFIVIDQWTLQNRITKAMLDAIADKKHWLIACITSIFLFSIIFVCINTITGMHWYNFEEILASPKTSYATVGFIGIFLGNFYPLVFSIHPLAFTALIIFSVFLIRHAASATHTYRSGLYLIVFMLLYYFGSTVSHIATISRYQIMLFPIAFILAGIALSIAFEILHKKISIITFNTSAFILLVITTASLAFSMSLYSGYASALLPKTYYTNIKDMGDGSYEAAKFLNGLPNAGDIAVWTDKTGVCTFFVGNCYSGFNFKNLKDKNIDYVVVSAGRKSRTSNRVNPLKVNIIRFDKYYDQTDNLTYALYIDNRPGNFVKIMPFKQ